MCTICVEKISYLAPGQFIHIHFGEIRKTGFHEPVWLAFFRKVRFGTLWTTPMYGTTKTMNVKIIQTYPVNLSPIEALLLDGSLNYPEQALSAKTKVE